MRNRRTARIIALVLVLIMAFSVIWVALDALTAKAAVTKEEIERLKEEKRDYERKKQEIQSRINTIEFTKMTEIAKKSVLDDRIGWTGMEINNINETIAFYGTLILEKEAEVVAAIARENGQLSGYKSRVRDMEENGIISYLEIIFDSISFSDLLARIDFITDIMQADENIYNNLIKAKEDTQLAKVDLEQTKLDMEYESVLLVEKLDELAEQLEEANNLILRIEADLVTNNELYEVEAAEADRIQREINTKEDELRRQEAAALAASRRGTGQLMWPVPSCWEVSSEFGTRLHPIFGVFRTHSGIDIPGQYGENVIASDSGTVITSDYSSSYGNYIVISHGGMTTLYAHLSSRAVGYGDGVNKGQVIGKIGSTGNSTGPHLHFEVSINGERVDPMRLL